jgi:hypothetical protein
VPQRLLLAKDKKHQRIAVETLTLIEVSHLFQKSIEIAMPKMKGAIEYMAKKVKKAKITDYKWVKTYEEFKARNLISIVIFYLIYQAQLLV